MSEARAPSSRDRNWSANRRRPSWPIAARVAGLAASSRIASLRPARSRGGSKMPVSGMTTSRAPSTS